MGGLPQVLSDDEFLESPTGPVVASGERTPAVNGAIVDNQQASRLVDNVLLDLFKRLDQRREHRRGLGPAIRTPHDDPQTRLTILKRPCSVHDDPVADGLDVSSPNRCPVREGHRMDGNEEQSLAYPLVSVYGHARVSGVG